MRYLSVCSGIEAATIAWKPLGWSAAAFSEIAKFPRAVLKHHYPGVPLHTDFTTIGAQDYGFIEILVGGTPCQSFSVAGLRKGLDDERGNLALEFIKLADRKRPRWIVWENVPGVLSSNGGRDFGAFLGALVKIGYGFAYRVLDAQYVRVQSFSRAVPQRRRRVFVVGYLGDWRRAAAVLFEPEGMRGDSPPRRQSRQDVAPTISSRSTGGGGLGTDFDCDGGLIAAGVAPTLNAHFGDKQGLENQHINAGGGYSSPTVAHCLNAGAMGRIDAESETLIPTHGAVFDEAVAFAENSRAEVRLCGGDGSVSSQLTTGGGKPGQGQPVVAFGSKDSGQDALEGVSPTLRSGSHDSSHANAGVPPAVATPWAVRRLTPLECERLQGFPDNFTRIPYRNKLASQCPNGPRYKALGNSMAVNCMRWIGERMKLVEELA